MKKPVVVFRTTGGSNAQPGAILSWSPGLIGAVSAVAGGALNAYGLDDDLKRTARKIRNFILHKKTVADYIRP